MKLTRKLLCIILALGAIMSMIVLPVSAAQTYDYTLTENVPKDYALKYGDKAYFHLEVEETGWHLLYGSRSGMPLVGRFMRAWKRVVTNGS